MIGFKVDCFFSLPFHFLLILLLCCQKIIFSQCKGELSIYLSHQMQTNMIMAEKLTIYSQNCRVGLSVVSKRRDLFQYERAKKYNIICLQDGHINDNLESFIKAEWGIRLGRPRRLLYRLHIKEGIS